jgi:hypothetical protein
MREKILLFFGLFIASIILIKVLKRLSYTNDCGFIQDELQSGKLYYSNSTVVICGLIRDAGVRIFLLKNRLYSITKYFKDYRILIVENDSTDDTRKYLLEWAKEDNKVVILGCGINEKECKLNLKKTVNHPIATWRIEKMVYLRNIYLEYIRNNLSKFNLMMVYDLDLFSSLDEKGLYHSGYLLTNNSVDAVCSNGIKILHTNYYDTYAHKEMVDDSIKDDFSDSNFKCDVDPRRVKSCFGGCTIYKIPSIMSYNYTIEFDSRNMPLCEHRPFNLNFNILFDPKWIHTVYWNP